MGNSIFVGSPLAWEIAVQKDSIDISPVADFPFLNGLDAEESRDFLRVSSDFSFCQA